MDLALLAVTAMGFVGVFLMLPRERATLARIGGLIGVLALGGFFVMLIRGAAETMPQAGGVSLFFYVFAAIMVMGSMGVVTNPRPLYAALYFVLVTLAGAALFVLLMAEFMAIVLIIVYAGAILVTYVFVLMLASQGSTNSEPPEYDRRASEPFWAVFVSFVLLGTILQALYPVMSDAGIAPHRSKPDQMMVDSQGQDAANAAPTVRPGNMQVLGVTLYGHYAFSLELAGILLTIALVGAVVIARKNVEYAEKAAGTGALPAE